MCRRVPASAVKPRETPVMTRAERIEKLRRYFLAQLAEGEGTPFDSSVLEALEELERRWTPWSAGDRTQGRLDFSGNGRAPCAGTGCSALAPTPTE